MRMLLARRRGGEKEGDMAEALGHGRQGGGVARKEGIAGRAGDFARRVIVKLSSIYFTNLHTTSAAVVAAARTGHLPTYPAEGSRDECPRLSKYMHHRLERGLVRSPVVQKGIAREDRLSDSSHVRLTNQPLFLPLPLPLFHASLFVSIILHPFFRPKRIISCTI